MANIRPMLAAKFEEQFDIRPELSKLEYPLLASPKIDGIRFMKPPGSPAMSRSWKPLPNKRLQNMVAFSEYDFFDGEVIVGNDPAAEGLFNKTQSAIMTAADESPLSLWFFDYWENISSEFRNRTAVIEDLVGTLRRSGLMHVNYVPHIFLNNPEEVLAYEEEALEAGYEGIMLRHSGRPYKYGRSTLREQGLIKVKRYVDEEAEIIGFEELQRNQNEARKNAFGLQVRGHSKLGKVAANTLGKLILRNDRWGEFACGSGLDDAIRNEIWQDKEAFLGKLVTYKYQPHGVKEKPRTPIFKGFRPEVE